MNGWLATYCESPHTHDRMDTSLALVLFAVFAAFCISIYRKRKQDALDRYKRNLQIINQHIAELKEDIEEEKKKKILEKIKKVGIYQCDQQNLHLR